MCRLARRGLKERCDVRDRTHRKIARGCVLLADVNEVAMRDTLNEWEMCWTLTKKISLDIFHFFPSSSRTSQQTQFFFLVYVSIPTFMMYNLRRGGECWVLILQPRPFGRNLSHFLQQMLNSNLTVWYGYTMETGGNFCFCFLDRKKSVGKDLWKDFSRLREDWEVKS